MIKNDTYTHSKRAKIGYLLFYVFLGVVFYSITYIIPPKISGQTARVITIVPPTVQESVDPGTKAEGPMKVENDGSETITVKAIIQDYVVSDKNGTPEFLAPNTLSGKYSASSWIGISLDSFTIPPHGKQDLTYFLQVPQNAGPGGHYAGILFVPVTSNQPHANGTSIQTEVGSLFYISVSGVISEFAQVTQINANPFQEYGPVRISAEIKNLGDIHIKPITYITITDLTGRNIKTLSLPAYNIFPSASRIYQTSFNDGFLIGRYKATLFGSYGVNNNLPLSKTIYFWVFPWKAALIIIMILIASILGVLVWKKK